MRTNIVIDDSLMTEALDLTHLNTKKAVVEEGLRLLVQIKKQEKIRQLRGKLNWNANLDEIRLMILPDTSVWIAYFNGINSWQSEYLDSFLQKEPMLIGDLIFAETLQGFRSDKDFKLAKKPLDLLSFVNISG